MTEQKATVDPIDGMEDNWNKFEGMTEINRSSPPKSVSEVQMMMAAVASTGMESLKSLQQALLLDDGEPEKPQNASATTVDVRRPASKSLLDTGFGMRNIGSFHDALRDAGHEVRSQGSDDNSCPCSSSESSISIDSVRMLVKGFGLRNIDSLERALLNDAERRKTLEEKYGKAEKSEYECESLKSWPSKCSSGTSNATSFASGDQKSLHRRQLEYLMGIDVIPEEFEGRKPSIVGLSELGEGEEESIADDEAVSLAMRRAQRYLRTHKIFEFFQFLVAHLLSALPENPVRFLLNLLDSCLMYRSGLGNPPLLFEIRHLVELFYLMDRMKTGFIEPEQYKTGNITYGHSPTPLKSHQPHIFQGMVTLGICSYNKNPPLSPDGMVAKETFIEEAYECLCDLLSDMIRRRGPPLTPTKSTPLMTPPPSFADLGFGTNRLDG